MAEAPLDVTLTAGDTPRAGTDPSNDLSPGSHVGRYRLLRVLGAGGMGVVWAAHDPDLDREVALKVLRHGDAGPAQRARLLREARAMAKVRHPNVIMVHEVGTADGRDFVAMDIVRGRTVAQWLADEPVRRDVVRVLRDAGRGLAAAHAAGLVHRDFKPHNVLLDDDGGVVVTDFGLARAAGADDPPSDAPRRALPAAAATASTTPRTSRELGTLDGALTEVGALLGTPAYMAPEQIDGVAAGPRADQFSYCVAVWEALTGARPFAGKTVAELRSAIDRGPIGGSSLSRDTRAALRRGLDPDPGKRWPDVGALLHALDRKSRHRYVVAAVLAVAVIPVLVLLLWPSAHGATRTCDEPAPLGFVTGVDPDRLTPAVRRPLVEFDASYRPAYQAACKRDDQPMVRCLDGEAAFASVLASASAELSARHVAPDLGALVPSPSSCYAQPTPSFPQAGGDLVTERAARVAAAMVRMRAQATETDHLREDAEAAVDRARKSKSNVALSEALLAQADALMTLRQTTAALDAVDEALTTAELYHYDRVRAEATLGKLMASIDHGFDRDKTRALRAAANGAIERAGRDPIHMAALDFDDALTAWISGHLDDAIDSGSKALDVFEQRGAIAYAIGAARIVAECLSLRGGPGDTKRAQNVIARIERRAIEALGEDDERTRSIHRVAMDLAWKQGDHAAVDELRARIRVHPSPRRPWPGVVRASGKVVDEQGAPVAGAEVMLGVAMSGDDRALDLSAGGEWEVPAAVPTTSGSDGTFAIDGVPGAAWAIAQTADGRRSAPAPVANMPTLVVGPTTRVTGRVVLRGHPPSALVVDAVPKGMQVSMWSQRAPVAADGSFSMERLPRGRWSVRVREDRPLGYGLVAAEVVADRPEVGPITLAMPEGGATIDVVVRGDRDVTIPMAEVYAVPGRIAPTNLAALISVARAEPSARSAITERASRTDERVGDVKIERGDQRGTLTNVPSGEATVCVLPFGSDTFEASGLASLYLHAPDIDVHCRTITADPNVPRQSMLFSVPPMKRFQ